MSPRSDPFSGPLALPVPDPGTGSRETVACLAELLGGARATARARAEDLLHGRDLMELATASAATLEAEAGLPPACARRIVAAFAMGRLVEHFRRPRRPSMAAPDRVHELLAPRMRGLEHETFVALLLDGKHRLRRLVCVSVGTLTTSLVHPREVFRTAIREAAAALIVAHNHPSGDPEPSQEDLEVTRRLRAAGDLIGVPLLDHVVIGEESFVSLRERTPGWDGGARSNGRVAAS